MPRSYPDYKAVFQIINLGDQWPRLGEINIYEVSSRALVTKRRIRLGNSQQARFHVRPRANAANNADESFGSWLAPSWFERGVRYGAKISCGAS